MDFSQFKAPNNSLTLKLFNRAVKFINYSHGTKGHGNPIVFDVPFCDVEILYGTSQNNTNLSFDIVTDDPRQQPIKLVSIEIFGQNKKEFGFKEKIKKLEKHNAEKLRA